MGDRPRCSVFLPSFCKPQYVHEAIASVLAQTETDFEFIIAENSTDDGKTRAVVKKAIGKDARVRYEEVDVPEQTRKTVTTEALLKNRFFAEAKGEYIMILCDDDLLKPTCIEKHLEFFAKHPGCLWNYHHVETWMMSTGQRLEGQHIYLFDGRRCFPGGCIDGGAIMLHRSILEHLAQPWFSLEPEDAAWTDAIFANRVAHLVPLYPMGPEVLSIKRQTPQSTFMKG